MKETSPVRCFHLRPRGTEPLLLSFNASVDSTQSSSSECEKPLELKSPKVSLHFVNAVAAIDIISKLNLRRHGGALVLAQEGCGFDSHPQIFLNGVCMFSLLIEPISKHG